MYWCINTLNNEAYEKIILKLVDDISEINLKRTNEIIKIQNKEIKTIEKKELITEFNNIDGESYINFSLLTPMAFKQRGRYVGYPDLRLIYQSIMNKYSAASQEMIMIDEDVLEQMVDNSNITKFFVKSKTFPLEGINIAGAVGNIRIKISGPDLMKRYESKGVIPEMQKVSKVIERAWYVAEEVDRGVPAKEANEKFRKKQNLSLNPLMTIEAGLNLTKFEAKKVQEGLEAKIFVDKDNQVSCEIKEKKIKIKTNLKLPSKEVTYLRYILDSRYIPVSGELIKNKRNDWRVKITIHDY